MLSKDNDDKLLTAKEVANLLGVVSLTVKRWAKDGRLKSVRINRRGDMRFKREDIEIYLQNIGK